MVPPVKRAAAFCTAAAFTCEERRERRGLPRKHSCGGAARLPPHLRLCEGAQLAYGQVHRCHRTCDVSVR